MKQLLILLALGLLMPQFIQAQSYNTAVGMRLGTEWGPSIQQRILKKTTIEAIIQSSLQREELLLTGLVEQHFPIISKRFNIYMGAGLHKGWIQEPIDEETGEAFEDPFGITMIMGIELTLGRINISYDFKPAVNIDGGARGFYSQTGLTMRYVIFKKKSWFKRVNWKFWEKK